MNTSRGKFVHIGSRKFERYLSKDTIRARIHELGIELAVDYHDKDPLFIIVLNGAFMFAADLVRACDFECELQFVKLSSYAGTDSTGIVKKIIGMQTPVKDRHIVIIEDIVDTGKTIQSMFNALGADGPASVNVATLLLKPDCMEYEMDTPYVGFEIPDAFVVGYGLDLDGRGRNLEDIYQLVSD